MSTPRKAIFTLAALGLTAFAAHPASAQTVITGLFDTGVDANGVVVANGTTPDMHYTLNYYGSSLSNTPTAYTDEVRTSAGGYPIPPYLPDSNTSAWVGAVPPGVTPSPTYDLSGPVGLYEYTTTFTVSGITSANGLGSGTITGKWASDDTGPNIFINGVATGNMTASGFTGYTPFTINAANLVNGTNTLTFEVNNVAGQSNNPTSLRVDGISASAAPEPSQIGMLALAVLGLGALAVKARKRTTAGQAA